MMIRNLKQWSLPGLSALLLLVGSYVAASAAIPQDQETTEREKQLQRQLEDLQAQLKSQNQVPKPQELRPDQLALPPAPTAPGKLRTRLGVATASTVRGFRLPPGFLASRYRVSAESARKVAMLKSEIKQSEDATEKEALKGELKDELEKQYDAYLTSLEQPLIEMEERVKTLREKFEKRKSNRDEMINLEVQTIWYEANGMGWPGRSGNLNFFPGQNENTFWDPAEAPFDLRPATPALSPTTTQPPFEDAVDTPSINQRKR